MGRPFRKLLVANRGEIALRVLRGARDQGYRTVAVYSDADQDAPFVRVADEALRLGPAEPAKSYLSVDALLEACQRSGADALHPGYGFLAESPALAEACAEAGIVFVGASPQAMRLAGDKARAKALAAEVGVLGIPAVLCEALPFAEIAQQAATLGYPLLVKAAAGGGGRGMRRVHSAADLQAALVQASAEAQAAFGDGRVFVERVITDARHIEIQVAADAEGRVVALGERDCSVQRRYQKVIEEAPSPAVDSQLRSELEQAAIKVAKAAQYLGVGTVEFLLHGRQFYFLEMNTRLQVEHPVTEMVTGIDLVALQLDIAAGYPLRFEQDAIRCAGHAIEARLYAEDPEAGYAPQCGRIAAWQPPDLYGVRVDAGIAEGQEVSEHYDPLLAKIIATGRDRHEALRRLQTALEHTVLLGVRHNLVLLSAVLQSPEFVRGEATTSFLDQKQPSLLSGRELVPWQVALAAALMGGLLPRTDSEGFGGADGRGLPFSLDLEIDGRRWQVRLFPRGPGRCRVSVADAMLQLHLLHRGPRDLVVEVDGHHRRVGTAHHRRVGTAHHRRVSTADHGHGLWLSFEGRPVEVAAVAAGTRYGRDTLGPGDGIDSPGAGRLLSLHVEVGELVRRGQLVAQIEAMKIETSVVSPRNGVVASLHVQQGQRVERGTTLVTLAAPARQGS